MSTASTMQQKFFSLHSMNREKEEFCKQMAASQILCSLFYLQKELRSSSRHQQKQKIIHILSLSRWAQKTHGIQKKKDRTFWQILWAKKLLVKEKNELTKNFKQTRFWIYIRKLKQNLWTGKKFRFPRYFQSLCLEIFKHFRATLFAGHSFILFESTCHLIFERENLFFSPLLFPGFFNCLLHFWLKVFYLSQRIFLPSKRQEIFSNKTRPSTIWFFSF